LIGDVSPLYVNTSSSTVQAASELASDLGLVPMPLSRRMVYALCSDTLRSGPCSINDLLGCVLRAAALKKFSENIRPRQRLRHLIEECGMDDAVKVTAVPNNVTAVLYKDSLRIAGLAFLRVSQTICRVKN